MGIFGTDPRSVLPSFPQASYWALPSPCTPHLAIRQRGRELPAYLLGRAQLGQAGFYPLMWRSCWGWHMPAGTHSTMVRVSRDAGQWDKCFPHESSFVP